MHALHRIVAITAGAGTAVSAALLMVPMSAATPAHPPTPFLSQFHQIRTVASTVPGNGDQNPYGIVVISSTVGRLRAGDVLISGRMSSAGTGFTLTSGGSLAAPLGLAVAPNGDVLTVNGNNGRVVETVASGKHAGMQVATLLLDKTGSPKGAGALFGLTIAPGGSGVYYVDDAVNTLRLLH